MAGRKLPFALLGLPILFCLLWGIQNTAYPFLDDGSYLRNAQEIYFTFHRQGWLEGIKAFYFDREAHRIIHPAIGSLIFAADHGSVLWTVRLSGMLYLTILMIFSYLGLHLVLPKKDSAIGAALIGLLPWCIQSARYYGAEIPEVAFAAGTLYWICRSWKANEIRAPIWISVFLGIALCLRLTEAFTFLLIPILFWFLHGLKRGVFRHRDWIACALAALPFPILFLDEFSGPLSLQLFLLLSPTALLLALRHRLGLNRALTSAFTTAYVTMSVWYAPFLHELYFYIRVSTYGAATVTAQANYPISKIKMFISIWTDWGGPPLLLLWLAALLTITKRDFHRLKLIFSIGVSTVFFPILLGISTHNPSTRYYFSSVLLAHIIALLLALSPDAHWRRIRTTLVTCALVYCLIWNTFATFKPQKLKPLSENTNNGCLASPPGPRGGNDSSFMDKLESPLNTVLKSGSKVCYLSVGSQTSPERFMHDGNILNLILRERDYDSQFLADCIHNDLQKNDYIFVGPVDNGPIFESLENRISKQFIDEAKSGRLIGWNKVGEYELTENGEIGVFFLLKKTH